VGSAWHLFFVFLFFGTNSDDLVHSALACLVALFTRVSSWATIPFAPPVALSIVATSECTVSDVEHNLTVAALSLGVTCCLSCVSRLTAYVEWNKEFGSDSLVDE
jgi:hypothetical protein